MSPQPGGEISRRRRLGGRFGWEMKGGLSSSYYGGGKHTQVAGEIICLDCFHYNKLYMLTSGCLNGGENLTKQVRLIMMTATCSVKQHGGSKDDPKYILGSHTSSKDCAIL